MTTLGQNRGNRLGRRNDGKIVDHELASRVHPLKADQDILDVFQTSHGVGFHAIEETRTAAALAVAIRLQHTVINDRLLGTFARCCRGKGTAGRARGVSEIRTWLGAFTPSGMTGSMMLVDYFVCSV